MYSYRGLGSIPFMSQLLMCIHVCSTICVRNWPSKSVRHCVEHLSFRVFSLLFFSFNRSVAVISFRRCFRSIHVSCLCFVVSSHFVCAWGLLIPSAHFHRVFTVCALPSYSILFTCVSHTLYMLYAHSMGRENNELKMDCAICCAVFLFFGLFCRLLHMRMIVQSNANLFRTVHFHSVFSK